MGLTASHSSSSDGSVPSSVPIASASASTIPTLSSSTLGAGSAGGSTSLVSSAISPDYVVGGPGGGAGGSRVYTPSMIKFDLNQLEKQGTSRGAFMSLVLPLCTGLSSDGAHNNAIAYCISHLNYSLGNAMYDYYIDNDESYPKVTIYFANGQYYSAWYTIS